VGPSDPEKSILDCTLVGPFADSEIADVEKAAKWLVELKAEASADDVRGAIDSGSPATAILAMARLRKDGNAKPADYARAVAAVPAEYMENLMVEMLVNDPTFLNEASAALKDEMGRLSSSRRSQVLNAIAILAKECSPGAKALAESVENSPTTKPKD
jgi:hypothetical protein